MIKLGVSLADRSYPIYITNDYTGLGRCLAASKISGKLVVVTDDNVDRYQSQECMDALESAGYGASKYVFGAGEKNKNLETIKDIYKYLLDLKLDRNGAIIALGGGVAGDIAGFAAATFLRGIGFIQVPTSLLAQADSSVGGKVGVDFEGSKNIIGAFYQPRFVYMNVGSLRTLPVRELRSGLAEVVKHGIIADEEFFEYIDHNVKRILDFNTEALRYLSKVNCSIKGRVVEQDERESGLRAILNFGHTIGHAVETVSDFGMLHGECVSIGMVGAFKLAQRLGIADANATGKAVSLLERIGLPVSARGMDVETVYSQMFRDKKVKSGKLTFILPKRIGEVVQYTIDDEKLIKSVLSELFT